MNFAEKILKEGENFNISDLETLVLTCMQMHLAKTLDAICNTLVENPNLACTYIGISYVACKNIVLVTSKLYYGDD